MMFIIRNPFFQQLPLTTVSGFFIQCAPPLPAANVRMTQQITSERSHRNEVIGEERLRGVCVSSVHRLVRQCVRPGNPPTPPPTPTWPPVLLCFGQQTDANKLDRRVETQSPDGRRHQSSCSSAAPFHGHFLAQIPSPPPHSIFPSDPRLGPSIWPPAVLVTHNLSLTSTGTHTHL